MNVIALTRELIAIPSVNPTSLASGGISLGEAAMAERIETLVREMGATKVERWEVYPNRPNVTAYFDFGADHTLIFDAHMDTVPVDGMTVDPYGGELLDGKVYGRGACDVKGPMAAMLCAIYRISQSAEPATRYNVLFAAVCDEEAGFGGVTSFVNRLNHIDYAPIEGAIVAEPTLLNPVVAHKGAVRWTISTSGVAAHSSTPHLGHNAIYQMAPVIQRLQSHAAELQRRTPHENLGVPSLSIGIIRGGSAVNIVPDLCEIQLDRRLIPGETVESARLEVERALHGTGALISAPIVAAPPTHTDAGHPLVRSVVAAASQAGADPIPEYASYCTDASLYPEINVPTVVFGPGSIAQAHTKDEWITVEQLEMGVCAYETLVKS